MENQERPISRQRDLGGDLFEVVEVLEGILMPLEEQDKRIKRAIDYLTSIRDYHLFTNGKLTKYDIEDSANADMNWEKFSKILSTHTLEEFGLTIDEPVLRLNKYITELHEFKRKRIFEGNSQLSNFLYGYQTAFDEQHFQD